MSTRASISIDYGNKVVGIYNHHDGYLKGLGKTLKENYNSKEGFESIIELGDASCVEPKLENSIFYTRDRDEDFEGTKPFETNTYEEFYERMEQEYNYVFDVKKNKIRVFKGDISQRIEITRKLNKI